MNKKKTADNEDVVKKPAAKKAAVTPKAVSGARKTTDSDSKKTSDLKKTSNQKKTIDSKKAVDSNKPSGSKKGTSSKTAAAKSVASKTKKSAPPKKTAVDKKPGIALRAKKVKPAPSEASASEIIKAAISEKTAGAAPVYAKDPASVTSARTENLYGRHYIIETNQDLPENYGKDRLIVLVRDPEWVYVYWELSEGKIDEAKRMLKFEDLEDARKILRVHDLSEKDGERTFDLDLSPGASSWYINVRPDSVYSIELGFIGNGQFASVLKSNEVGTPRHDASRVTDEKWMVKEADFKQIYELSGGSQTGRSSADIMQAMARGMNPEEFTAHITAGISSEILSSQAKQQQAIPVTGAALPPETLSSQTLVDKQHAEEAKKKERKFWLVVNTELIVYGATEPDAAVTIMGQPIKLRPDGTFSIRMALPDGDIDIPVKGVSADKIDEITITPCVHKNTDYGKKENVI